MRFSRLALAVVASVSCTTADTPISAPSLRASSSIPAAASYIVQLKSSAGASHVWSVAHGVAPKFAYSKALHGFAAELSPEKAEALIRDPEVVSVTPDGVMTLNADQLNPPSWGLDRIDQRTLPLDHLYSVARGGAGIHVYDIDSGIRTDHVDFVGRIGNGINLSDANTGVVDCIGHGTHTAGTIGGTSYGVAKAATIHPVRVFGCTPSVATSVVIAGMDWVAQNAIQPAVVNMSLGGSFDAPENAAVQNLVAAGIVVVVSAGNDNTDACTESPSSEPLAITVGATDINDVRATFSNFGSCLDLFAPGVSIVSDWYTSSTATATISGTSMAAPHVTGTVALLRAENPLWTPQQIDSVLYMRSTKSVVITARSTRFHLLYTGSDDMADTISPPPAPVAPPAPSGLSATLDSIAGKGKSTKAYVTVRWADYGISNVMTDVEAVNTTTGATVWYSALPGFNSLVDILPTGHWDFYARTRWYQGTFDEISLVSVPVGPVHVDACPKTGTCR